MSEPIPGRQHELPLQVSDEHVFPRAAGLGSQPHRGSRHRHLAAQRNRADRSYVHDLHVAQLVGRRRRETQQERIPRSLWRQGLAIEICRPESRPLGQLQFEEQILRAKLIASRRLRQAGSRQERDEFGALHQRTRQRVCGAPKDIRQNMRILADESERAEHSTTGHIVGLSQFADVDPLRSAGPFAVHRDRHVQFGISFDSHQAALVGDLLCVGANQRQRIFFEIAGRQPLLKVDRQTNFVARSIRKLHRPTTPSGRSSLGFRRFGVRWRRERSCRKLLDDRAIESANRNRLGGRRRQPER